LFDQVKPKAEISTSGIAEGTVAPGRLATVTFS
jgi:hypothetical protein